MASSIGKVLRRLRPKAEYIYGGLHLAWPSPPITSQSTRSLRSPLKVPHLDNSRRKRPLTVLESTYYLIAPKQRGEQRWRPWIVRAEVVDPTTWRLVNPVRGSYGFAEYKEPIMGVMGNPSNYLIKELATSYTPVGDYLHYSCRNGAYDEPKASKFIPLWDPETSLKLREKFTLLYLDWKGQLGLWKQGDESWKPILHHDELGFSDIVSYRGKFYACRSDGMFVIDPNKDDEPDKYEYIDGPILPPVGYSHCFWTNLDNGKLHLLFTKYPEIMIMYALDIGDGTEAPRWDIVKSFNDEVLFGFNEVSFSVPAYLLDRKFGGDWICDNGYDTHRYASYSASSTTNYCVWLDDSMQFQARYADYYDQYFYKIYLNSEDDGNKFCEESFEYDLPEDEYTSLFYETPPWLQYLSQESYDQYDAARVYTCT